MIRYFLLRHRSKAFAFVDRDGGPLIPLPHLVLHSPSGFEWGYSGSGPADLARSIVGHHFDVEAPHPALYQHVKEHLISTLPEEGGVIEEDEVDSVAFPTTPAGMSAYLPRHLDVSDQLLAEIHQTLQKRSGRPGVQVDYDPKKRIIQRDDYYESFEWWHHRRQVVKGGGHVSYVADAPVGPEHALYHVVSPIGGGWDDRYVLVVEEAPTATDDETDAMSLLVVQGGVG